MSAARVGAVLDAEAMRRRLQRLEESARQAVDDALAQAAAETAAAVRASLPAGPGGSARATRADGTHAVVVDGPDARAREFGTRGQTASPVLRPAAAAAAERARPTILAALVAALKAGRA